MKKIIFTTVLILAANTIIAQTYNMKIKQGTGSTYSETSTVDEVTFLNTSTTPFACGDVILYGGETYPTVQIGSQCWFQKNLNIGTRIASGSDQSDNGTFEKYCYDDWNIDPDANCKTHGGLYQWAEAVQYKNEASNTTSPNPAFSGNVQGICPLGWHIPTYAEFQTLSTYVSGNSITLKALGQGSGDGTGLNISGFSALLAGARYSDGTFDYVGVFAYIWSSTESSVSTADHMNLNYIDSNIGLGNGPKELGHSVRCLKD